MPRANNRIEYRIKRIEWSVPRSFASAFMCSTAIMLISTATVLAQQIKADGTVSKVPIGTVVYTGTLGGSAGYGLWGWRRLNRPPA